MVKTSHCIGSVVLVAAVLLGSIPALVLKDFYTSGVREAQQSPQALRCQPDGSPQKPVRALSDYEVHNFYRDGVIMASGLFSESTIDAMASGVQDFVDNPSVTEKMMSAGPGYVMSAFMWTTSDLFRDVLWCSPAASIAAQVFGFPQRVNAFYDQFFYKAPGASAPTPWHQDLTFWPIRHVGPSGNEGDQILSIWIALEDVDLDSSGLEYVNGSHRWTQRFRSVDPSYNPVLLDSDLQFPPNIGGYNTRPGRSEGGPALPRDDYSLLSWNMKRGDAVLFHPLALHGSPGNNNTHRSRTGLALRFTGDDVVYSSKPGSMEKLMGFDHGLSEGDPVGGPIYPQVWPRRLPQETAYRAAHQLKRNPMKFLRTVLDVGLASFKQAVGKLSTPK